MIWPHEPTGQNALASFLRRLLRACRASELKSSPDIRIRRTSGGTTLELAAPSASCGPGVFKLKSVADDYLVCRTWTWNSDATTGAEGTTDVYIAKPWKLRTGAHSTVATPYGVTHNYSYHDGPDGDPNLNRIRWDSVDSFTTYEIQAVRPPWIVDDPIWASPVADSGARDPNGNLIALMAERESRVWAKTGTGP